MVNNNFKLLVIVLLASTGAAHAVLGYYANAAKYRPGIGCFSLDANLNTSFLTHAAYSFANPDENGNLGPTENSDIKEYDTFRKLALRSNPNVKVMLSIGGWSFNANNQTASYFSSICADSIKRVRFVNSTISYARRYGFDGLDFDWEFPGLKWQGGTSNDKTCLTLMMQLWHESIFAEASSTGKTPLILTLAVPGAVEHAIKGYEISKIHSYIDFLVVMAYELHGRGKI